MADAPVVKEPKILLWDIETSHNIVAVFQLGHNDWINPDNILQERYVICASWQWLGDSKIHSVSVLDNDKLYSTEPHNDKHVIETLHGVLSEADAIVHHNGNAFDNKFVETRILVHNLNPLPPIPHIDTLRTAKTRFLFNSNRLEYLAGLLGVGKKKAPHGNEMWLDILKGGEKAVKAIKKMVKYNKQDIVLLREVFLKLRPYMPDYLNRRLFMKEDNTCPRCGSHHIQSRGVHRAVTQTYQKFVCVDCGGWFRGSKAIPKAGAQVRVL